jgi:hypothetical protein
MEDNPTDPIHFLNLEYFFRRLYDSIFGVSGFGVGDFGIVGIFSSIWIVVTVLSYIASIVALLVLVFTTIRMRQIFEDEHHLYSTLSPDEAEKRTDNSRWEHIISLIESPQESDWRQAIVEADIMLEEMLIERKYEGETTHERLERADPSSIKTLAHAKEAHKVRNELAHYGATYHLEDNLAYRAIKNYEAVFVEFGEIDVGAAKRAQSYAHA